MRTLLHITGTLLRTAGPPAILAATLAVLVAANAAGCASARVTEPRAFPETLDQQRVLDVQVSRRGTKLFLTNTTARSFGAGTMWVNRRFSAPVPPLGIGETLELDLRGFVDDNDDPFRAGGIFATRDPDQVVLVQLEVAGRLLGLVIVENRL